MHQQFIAVLAALALFAAACGGGDDPPPPLHLTDFDIGEEQWALAIRADLVANFLGATIACGGLRDLSQKQALDYVAGLGRALPASFTRTPFVGETPRPGQVADQHSRLKAVRIAAAECARMFPRWSFPAAER